MINFFDFLAVVLASGAIIQAWHHGSIFANWRAYLQAVQDVTDPETLKGRFLELVMCPFCKSYHAPLYLFLLLLAGDWIGGTIGAGVRIVIYSFAATRLGNIVDGLLPPDMRYDPPIGVFHDSRKSE